MKTTSVGFGYTESEKTKYYYQKMNSTTRQAKSMLRKEMKQILKDLTEASKSEQSNALLKKVIELDVYKQSRRISIFLPMSDEVNTLPILTSMFNDGKECYIPHYTKDDMIMVRLASWADYQQLPTTSWGIKQPAQFDRSQDSLNSGGLDLIFMPGLAFTLQGARLGRGKGYYDKYLMKHSHSGRMPHTVALVFKEQIVKELPVTDNDFFVNSVLFPSPDELSS